MDRLNRAETLLARLMDNDLSSVGGFSPATPGSQDDLVEVCEN